MSEETLKVLYPLGLRISLFSGIFMFFVILAEWFFISRDYVIPTTFSWLTVMITMWVTMLIIGAKK